MLGVVGIGAVKGLARGMILTLFDTVGYMAAVAVATIFTRPAAATIDGIFHLESWVTQALSQIIPLPAASASPSGVPAADLVRQVGGLGLPQVYERVVLARLSSSASSPAGGEPLVLSGLIYDAIGNFLVTMLVFFVLFLLTKGILSLTGGLFHRVFGAGVLSLFNRAAGLVLGAVRSGIILAVLLGVLVPALSLPAFAFLNRAVAGSTYASLLVDSFYLLAPWFQGLDRNAIL